MPGRRSADPPSKPASSPTSARYIKELYDLLTGTLLGPTLLVAVCAWVLHLVATWLAELVGTDLDSIWQLSSQSLGTSESLLRFLLFSALHLGLLVSLYGPTRQGHARLRTWSLSLWGKLDKRLKTRLGTKRYKSLKTRASRVKVPDRVSEAMGVAGTLVTTLLLVALLLQPTLVPLKIDRSTWLLRAANLVDGTASASIVDSVVSLARRFYAEPVQSESVVGKEDFDAGLAQGTVPLMDRWDEEILEAAEGDRELFAKTKAFMWVESGGRQFAVSATGCAGLMQFCASTAQRRPFGSIFGTGQVAACGCSDCSVSREIQVALETDPAAVSTYKDTFPCDLADARFDAVRSIRAGVAYVRELSSQTHGQLPLMYVGYNAGPKVATNLFKTLAPDTEISIDDLRPHLADALRPYYGAKADGRANGLLDVHLPKLMEAYERWR